METTCPSCCSSVNRLPELVPLPLSRLLLIMDYLLHYFYDPPPALMDQVQWNLFGAHTKTGNEEPSDNLNKTHFACREVEENYLKSLTSQQAKENLMKPRFYNLGPANYTNQDAPKVDGLACSFLLGNADMLNYNQLYDAILVLLGAATRCDLKPNFSLLVRSWTLWLSDCFTNEAEQKK